MIERVSEILGWLRQQRWLRLAINILLAVLLAIFLGRALMQDWSSLTTVTVDWRWLAASQVVYAPSLLLFIWAWQRLMSHLAGFGDWKQNTAKYCYTNMTRNLPTVAWFLAGRVYVYSEVGVSYKAALAATGIEAALHALTGLSLMGLIRLAKNPAAPGNWAYLVCLVPLVALVWRPRWLLGGLKESGMDKSQPRTLGRGEIITWMVIYSLTWIDGGLFFYTLLRTFVPVMSLDWLVILDVWLATSLASYVGTFLLGGLGILREFTMTWMLAPYFLPASALAVAAGSRLALMGGSIVWSMFGLALVRLATWQAGQNDEIVKGS